MHFMVYIPGEKTGPERLAELGLPGLVDGAFCAHTPGPDGRSGTMLSWSPITGPNRGRHVLGYDQSKQTWRPSAAAGEQETAAYWYGTINASPPIPDDLQRTYPYRCVEQELGDNRKWWFPAERDLPYTAKLSDDGSWRFVPQREMDSFCHAVSAWRLLLKVREDAASVLLTDAWELVRLALGINYRLIPELESDLGLWTSSNAGTICKAFFQIIASEGTL